MKRDKPKTPSKEELLNELESIRDFLGSNEDLEIPTLTMIAEHSADLSPAEGEYTLIEDSSLKSAHQNETEFDLDLEPDYPTDAEKETPHIAEQDTEHTQVQVKQSTLFDDDIYKSENNSNSSASDDDTKPTPKARGENPFLPPHIRDRLGRHKELFESVPDEIVKAMALKDNFDLKGDFLHNAAQFDSEKLAQIAKGSYGNKSADLNKSIDPNKEAIIDELVDELLPLIEAKLRAKLRSSTLKDDK